jgi:hypothetical protein
VLASPNAISAVTAQRGLPLFFERPDQASLNQLDLTLNQLQGVSTNPLASQGFTNPILGIDNSGNSFYHGLSAILNQRFSQGFQLYGTWTWSHLSRTSPGLRLTCPSAASAPIRSTIAAIEPL